MSLKENLVEVCHKVYSRGFVSAYDGNLSVRTESSTVLITASGKCKGEIKADDILEVDLNGNLVSGKGKISTENRMHLFAYSKRKNVNAVVHCHPVYATAFALTGNGFEEHYLPEVVLTLGKIPLCRFGMPSTEEVVESIKPYIEHAWAMLLENHGALTLGKDINDAYYKMEKLEHYARIIFLASQIGNPNKLSSEIIQKLLKLSESTYEIEPDIRNIF